MTPHKTTRLFGNDEIRQENGKSVKIPFDYAAVEKGRNLEQNITLKRGDVVVVP